MPIRTGFWELITTLKFYNKYVVIDHALIEFFYDLLALQDYRKELKNNHVEHFSVAGNHCLLTATSERYIGQAARIPPEKVSEFWKTHNFVISSLAVFSQAYIQIQAGNRFRHQKHDRSQGYRRN